MNACVNNKNKGKMKVTPVQRFPKCVTFGEKNIIVALLSSFPRFFFFVRNTKKFWAIDLKRHFILSILTSFINDEVLIPKIKKERVDIWFESIA